jgi:hypothetical protein
MGIVYDIMEIVATILMSACLGMIVLMAIIAIAIRIQGGLKNGKTCNDVGCFRSKRENNPSRNT